MKREKIAGFFGCVVACAIVVSTAQATWYDVDSVVNSAVIGGGYTGGVTGDGYPIVELNVEVTNTSAAQTFTDVKMLMQWSWVQDWTAATGNYYFPLDWNNVVRRWEVDSPGATYGEVQLWPNGYQAYILMNDIVDIRLNYQEPGFGAASVALTDSLPYWHVADSLAPGESQIISAKIAVWEVGTVPPTGFNGFARGDVIATTPIPEPGSMALLFSVIFIALRNRRG